MALTTFKQLRAAVTEAEKSYSLYEYDACDPLATNSDEQNLEIFASKLADVIDCVLVIARNEGLDLTKSIKMKGDIKTENEKT